MENEFKVIRRLTESDKNASKYNCVEIDLSVPYQYNRPVVMCFTGNSGNKMEYANGFAKAVQNTSGIKDEVDYISIKYRGKYSVGTITLEDVEKFVDCFFVPLLQKNGRRISIEQVKRNLRKITIVTHCYGAEFLKYINHVLQDRMFKLGYKEDKIISILKSIIHIGYAPFTQSNYNTNIYFKSVNDKTFWGAEFDLLGEKFEDEVIKIIDKLPARERKKYYIKGKIYLGNGIIVNEDNFNFYGENLTGTILKRNDDHRMGSVLKDGKGDFLIDDENIHSHTMSKCFSYILNAVINNSIINEQEQQSLSFLDFKDVCNQFISNANSNETEMIKRKVLENSLEHITPEEAFKRMRVTEKDLLEGNVDLYNVDKIIVGLVDWDGSIYQKLKYVYSNPSVCFREYSKENINCTELFNHKEGIILNSGEVVPFNSGDTDENINLALMCSGKKLEGSVKYKIAKRNRKYFIVLYDNYGSREYVIKKDFISQIKYWKQEYKVDKFTLKLSEPQKTVIKNLCVFFDVDKNNIKIKSEQGINI